MSSYAPEPGAGALTDGAPPPPADDGAWGVSRTLPRPAPLAPVRPAPRAAPGPVPPVLPGAPEPLGACFGTGPDGVEGTNFALWAGGAEAVELCLFDDDGAETRCPLPELTHGIRHGFLPGVRPGQRYGYRVHGRWDPWTGARWNPAKLLLDPRARAVDGDFGTHGLAPEVYGHVRDWPQPQVADTVRDERDSAPYVPKGVVVADASAPGGGACDARPRTPWAETVIYELHVRGFTMRHPGVPAALRGTYAGLAHPAAVAHLTRLGVTAVELLPVHQFAHEEHLLRRGLRNYWGYNSIGWFAPHAGYAATGTRGEQVAEFREMVRALHAAGIEVLLDVVLNHTAEGGEGGPTLSLRGIDNGAYYHLAPHDRRRYADSTGCGNTFDAGGAHAVRLLTDSLRYWVREMGVDGFRFDLATALARTASPAGGAGVDMRAPFLTALAQDPVLRDVKLIAEPWDVGPGGYRVGGFPPPWSEWNDRFRDGVRDFWRGAAPDPRDLGYRLSGSSDLYGHGGRRPYASVNFVTAHDGFTLHDLVSHDRKHNAANGEGNRDGTDDNRSWNCGAEGPTDDPGVRALRRRQTRNLLATLLLSTGVPMLVAGDEMGRTQGGNNNAYCQDGEVSWVDWSLLASSEGRALCDFAARLLRLRREHPVLRRASFFSGRARSAGGVRDLAWFHPGGAEMTEADWFAPGATLGMYLSGGDIPDRHPDGGQIVDDSFLLLLRAEADAGAFVLPGPPWGSAYEAVLDTTAEGTVSGARLHHAGEHLPLPGRSLLLLRAHG